MSRSLLIFVVWMVSATAWGQEPTHEKIATVEGVSEYRFSNGARLLLFPEASKPTITVNLTVLVGSRHEGYGEAGMAHLLEHMVFKGTPTFAHVPTALRDHGASFNGTTNQDRTNYFETLPATDENLEFAIHLESDRLVNSYVKHEDLLSEFSVVRNEFERGENSPQGVLSDRVMAAAFEWHNYGKTTIGNRSDIERVPIDNLQAFYRKYYQPDNVVMIITGRFKAERALELAEKYLGSIPKPERKLTPAYTIEPPQDGERLVELRRVGQIGSLMAAYHMPAAAHEDWAPLSILASVISEDKVGLMEKKLVETRLATSASGRADNAHDPGLFTFGVQPTEGNLESAQQAMLQAIDGIGGETFDAAAISRAKMRAQRNAELMLADADRMASALSSAASVGDWRLLFIQRDRIQEVSLDDVQRVAKTYFPSHNRTLGVFIPTAQPLRAEIPVVESIAELVNNYRGGTAMESGEAFDPTPENLDARTKTLNVNGLKVALLQKENRGETVAVTVTLRYGNEDSLRDKTVAAGLLPGMLMAGTTTMNRQELQAKMTELGVRISAGGGGGGGRGRRGGGGGRGGSAGSLSFSVEAKRSSLAPAIKLLGEILRQPSFPEDDFEQMKSQMTNMLKQSLDEPQMLAGNVLSRSLSQYPKDDVRYVPTTEESIERIEKLTLDDVKEIYATQIAAAAGEIAVVGEFETGEVMNALGEILKDWNSKVEYRSIDREANGELTGKKESIKTPDKANAVFSAGLSFDLNDADADAEALILGNFIFGGSTLSSRIGDRIRQKEGLSYGATSSISIPSKGNDARFSINAITNPLNIEAVETAAMEELTRFLADGPTEQEVADAKNAWLEQQKVSRSSDGSVVGQMASNLHLDRTFEFIGQREQRLSQLTAGDIHAAFKKHIDPAILVIVRAGDFKE